MGGTGFGVAAGAVCGAIVALLLSWAVVSWIVVPNVIAHQVELCTAATEKAAADAIAAEQLRQFRAGELATEQFIKESQVAADDAQAQRDLLEMETKDYAKRMDDRGAGVCALDAAALELIGVRPAEPDRTGSR